MTKIFKKKKLLTSLAIVVVIFTCFFIWSFNIKNKLLRIYELRESIIIKDKNNKILNIKANKSDYYSQYLKVIPNDFIKALLQKEDKYFYYHPGLNPISTLRAVWNLLSGDNNLTSSTITQQLAKVLLANEFDRGIKNKIKETIYALALELQLSKDEILKMYANSIYLGNRVQGLAMASQLYFGTTPDNLDENQIRQILATISNPSNSHPFSIKNFKSANLAIKTEKERKNEFNKYIKNKNFFELDSIGVNCENDCNLTIDIDIANKLREILQTNLNNLVQKDAINGAIVVILTSSQNSEILAIIGSPDPGVSSYAYQMNMAIKPRPIGSTIKPFIYLKGFERNLRPYTRVVDREYKYIIDSGYAFYPKNYDYIYRGEVNLHYALTNSLNVPTVKVLEYVGIDNFNNFLINDLQFKPIQLLENYQLGIALGGLEMDLLTLSYYFSLLARNGDLKPLSIYTDKQFDFKTQTNFSQNNKISKAKYVQLLNKILSDRKTGVEQFGIKSDLNLYFDNYCVKTGTSREYHDSWTIGYTPDFVIGVWVGNAENTPMDRVSGLAGAGKIWHQAMNLLSNSKYNKKTKFDFSNIKEFEQDNSLVYGFENDNYNEFSNLLLDDNLILSPHNNDIFLLEQGNKIILRAKNKVSWYVNNEFLSTSFEEYFIPKKVGNYIISAKTEDKQEEIKIIVEK